MCGGSMYIKILLREIRKERNITLRKLEKMTGISKTHLSSIERNEKMPSLKVAITIAQALSIDITQLYEVIK